MYYIALQFYIKTSKVICNVFDYISKVIVIVISLHFYRSCNCNVIVTLISQSNCNVFEYLAPGLKTSDVTVMLQ